MSYQVIEPPGAVADPGFARRDVRYLVDYREHPAYSGFVSGPRFVTRLAALVRFVPFWLVI